MNPKQGYNSQNKALLGHRHLSATFQSEDFISWSTQSKAFFIDQEILPFKYHRSMFISH